MRWLPSAGLGRAGGGTGSFSKHSYVNGVLSSKRQPFGQSGSLLQAEAAVAPVGRVDHGAHVGAEAFIGVGNLVIKAAALGLAGMKSQTKAAVNPGHSAATNEDIFSTQLRRHTLGTPSGITGVNNSTFCGC